MTVKKDRSSPANREFWDAVAEASRTVQQWPAWKRGESTRASEQDEPVVEERTPSDE